MPKYRANIWPGEVAGSCCYEIVTPEGAVTVRGARIGTRSEVREHLRKFLTRSRHYIGNGPNVNLARL